MVSVAHLGEQDIEQAAEAAEADDGAGQAAAETAPDEPDAGAPPDPGTDT